MFEHLNEKGILHLRLHPSNVVLNLASYAIQLTNFSNTTSFLDKNETIRDPLEESGAETEYYPPERIFWRYMMPNGANSWFVGAVVHCLFLGEVC